MQEGYSPPKVAERLGIKYRTLMEWIEKGIIKPRVYKPGRGHKTKLSKKNVREIAILDKLREHWSLQRIRVVLDDLKKVGHNPLSTGQFLVIRGVRGKLSLLKICNHGKAIELIKEHPGQMTLLPILEEEEDRIEGMEPDEILMENARSN